VLLVVYILCLGIILGITFLGQNHTAVDLEGVYKKEIDFLYVFTENSKSMLAGALGGVATFGLASTYLFFYNAISLGTIANALVLGGMPDMALRMLPHGLVELVALVLVAVFPIVVVVYLLKQVKAVIIGDNTLGKAIKDALIFMGLNLAAVEGILLIAAVIEFAVSRL
jgi:uncharacterized membrane protein SpoIIM required for sporulation